MGSILAAIRDEFAEKNRLVFIAVLAAVTGTATWVSGSYQWMLLFVFFAVSLLVAPRARSSQEFFKGATRAGDLSVVVIAASVLISWIFAKSVVNVANLGYAFGAPGALAYAVYWGSFFVAGVVIYLLRTRGGFESIPAFLTTKYGRAAAFAFTVAILFRLFNEVWSNVSVVAGYFGAFGSWSYVASLLLVNALIVYYVSRGGMRASIATDVVQFALFAFLLVFTLVLVIPRSGGVLPLLAEGDWVLSAGVDLVLVASLQIFSYPFHDPVLTDRGFLQRPKAMLASFIIAGAAGILIIFSFGLIGIHGRGVLDTVGGDALRAVAASFGLAVLVVMNGIMISSAVSTVDSTFTSVSKVFGADLPHIGRGGRSLTLAGAFPIILGAIGVCGIFAGYYSRLPGLAIIGTGVVTAAAALRGKREPAIVAGAPALVFMLWALVRQAFVPWGVVATGLAVIAFAAFLLARDASGGLRHARVAHLLTGTREPAIVVARVAILSAALIGNLPLFFDPSLLAATTVSGTMVLGLAPIFLFAWMRSSHAYAFHGAFWTGVASGVMLLATEQVWLPEGIVAWVEEAMTIGTGTYGLLLGFNAFGLILAFAAFSLGSCVDRAIGSSQRRARAERGR